MSEAISPNLPRCLDVIEMFTSLQGEGSHMGFPCFFVRLARCNLRCNYCDTTYAYSGGEKIQIEEILRAWERANTKLVQITGGEPLLQPCVYLLMEEFLKHGARLLLETNGSLSIKRVPHEVIKVLDWKTPGSGFGGSFFDENLRYLTKIDQIKFVITSREDYEWSKDVIEKKFLSEICEILISPASGLMDAKTLADWVVEDKLPVRFQVQLHKILWGDKRGV